MPGGTRARRGLWIVVVVLAAVLHPTPAGAVGVSVSGTVTVGGVGRSGFTVRPIDSSGTLTTTDANGHWTLSLPPGPTRISVGAGAIAPDLPKVTSVRFDVNIASGQVLDVAIPAPADAPVTVLDTNGDPIAGMDLTAARTATSGTLTVPGTLATFYAEARATTDAAGEATFVDYPGLTDIRAHKYAQNQPERLQVLEDVGVQPGSPIDITFEAFVQLTGHVTSGGQDAERIHVTSDRDGAFGRGITDASGNFSLVALPGPSTLRAGTDELPYLALASTLEVTDSTPPLEIALPVPIEVAAHVVDTRGDAARAQVQLQMTGAQVTAPFVMPGDDPVATVVDYGWDEAGDVALHALEGTADLTADAPVTQYPLRSRLVTLDDVAMSDGVEVPITVPAVPTEPEEVEFTVAGPGRAHVTWAPPLDSGPSPVTSYEVLIGDPGWWYESAAAESAPPEPFIPPPPNTRSFPADARSAIITGLVDARPNQLRIRAYTAAGPGPWVSGSVTPRAAHRVDVFGRLSAQDPAVGDNEYSAGSASQVVLAELRQGTTARYPVTVQNDGSTRERMVVRDLSNASGLDVRWFVGTRNVTAAVRSGTYRTPLLNAGADQRLTAVVKVRAGVPRGSFFVVSLEAHQLDRPQRDAVSWWVTVRS